jgi:hypothetical protein
MTAATLVTVIANTTSLTSLASLTAIAIIASPSLPPPTAMLGLMRICWNSYTLTSIDHPTAPLPSPSLFLQSSH